MGVRLNKCVGYGFLDIVENDPRINWEQFEYAREATYKDFNSYFQMVKSRKDIEVIIHMSSTKSEDFNYNALMSQFVEYDSEFGFENVMLFNHIDYPQWSRRDDSIDYYDHMISNKEPTSRIVTIPGGIYPFNQGPVKHIESGTIMERDRFNVLRQTDVKMLIGNNVTVDFGDPDIDNQFASEVPSMINHVATFFGVDPDHIPNMKAALYEYWS